MKKVLLAIIAVLVIGGIWWLTTSNRTPDDQKDQAQSQKSPDFALQDFEGKTVHLSDFTGKPVVINSWAAWCPFCRKELVDFATAQKEFGDKITIIAVDRAESLDVAKKYTDELRVTGDLIFLVDPSDSFYQSIGGFSMPETIFVNKDGNIVDHKRGPMNVEEIRQKVNNLLQ
jgi:thiol-disulfide isomerase/thioredoxin